jgi:hypothetical protein
VRRLFCASLSFICAVGLWLGSAGGASAQVDWCSGEPPVQLVLPSGQPLTVNVWVAVPRSDKAALRAVMVSGEVVGVQGTVVRANLNVLVPANGQTPFPVQARAQSRGPANTGPTIQGIAGTTLVVPVTITLRHGRP